MDDTQTDTFDFLIEVQRRWLADASVNLQTWLERAGAAQSDAVNMVKILKRDLVSSADNLSDLMKDAYCFLAKRLQENQLLCRMWLVPANQKAVRAGVKAGLGKDSIHFDAEGMCGQAWMKLLPHLANYQFSSPKQEAAYLRELARNCARNELVTYRRRLTNAQTHQVDMERVLPNGYATSHEDLQECTPDPDRAPPIE